jgi:16S rRNA (uracil1498-N3)-methyltransferase
MSIPRIFQSGRLECSVEIDLSPHASHHLGNVLRARLNELVIIFNGEGEEYKGIIIQINKKQIRVYLKERLLRETESPLSICLLQGISRGEKMDYSIQKAVELGVKKIIPLLTERCTVKLDGTRQLKRVQHWRSIIMSACEQSGRNHVPELFLPMSLEEGLRDVQEGHRFVLSLAAGSRLKNISLEPANGVALLIGPEGGLSEQEMALSSRYGFLPLSLGPRVLRTETAPLAAITALQCYFGDMG